MPAVPPSPTPSPDEEPTTYATKVFDSLGAWALDSKGKIAKLNPLYHYHKAARWYSQFIHLMISPKMAIRAGIDKENADDYTEAEIAAFNAFCKILPGLEDILAEFYKEPQRLEVFCTWMDKWADDARNEDTSSLKKNAMKFLPLDPFKTPVLPPIPTSGKELRGFNHVMTARLLTPMKDIAEFDANHNTYIQKHADGQVKLTASRLPFFLYDETNYDPDIPDLGLLKGHFIIRVFRCLMTGPSSAIDKRRRAAKKSKAEIHNLDRPTAETIAYSCVLARQTLSSAECYSTTDGDFNYATFYDIIAALLVDKSDPWVNDVLEFYTRETPDLQRKTRNAPVETPDVDEAEEFLDEILELRRRRAQEKESSNENEQSSREDTRDSREVHQSGNNIREEQTSGQGENHRNTDGNSGGWNVDDENETLGREIEDHRSIRQPYHSENEEEPFEQRDDNHMRHIRQENSNRIPPRLHHKRARETYAEDGLENTQRTSSHPPLSSSTRHNTRTRVAIDETPAGGPRRRRRAGNR